MDADGFPVSSGDWRKFLSSENLSKHPVDEKANVIAHSGPKRFLDTALPYID